MSAIERGRRSTLADIMLFSAMRDRPGFSRVRSPATGGPAMGPETFTLFLAMGVPLKQLYGQTGTPGAYTLQNGEELGVETVRPPCPGCEERREEEHTSELQSLMSRS